MGKFKYQIIIPNWNQSTLCVNCLKSIKQYSKNYEIIFIDNGSKKDEFDIIFETLKTMPYKLVQLEENLGFIKAVNIGLSIANANYIVIMNNDTEAVENWLDKLEKPLKENENCVLSGSLTTTPESWQGAYKPTNQNDYVILPNDRMVAFFCTMFKKSVFSNVGLLDENISKYGFGDDDDYCKRVHNKGYRISLVQNLRIPHYHRSTFKQLFSETEIKEMQETALNKYRAKYGLR